MASCNVRVAVRFRPINELEGSQGENRVKLKYYENKRVDIEIINHATQTHVYDFVFPPDSKQSEVYEHVAKPVISDVIEGFNGTIFAYGQTGSGKTYTMMGEMMDPQIKGIIPRACQHVFDAIRQDKEGNEYSIKCSYLEIYNEQIQDLLMPINKNLKVKESPSKGIYVAGLHEEFVSCEEDIYDLIEAGGENRAVSATNMNKQSSRSHSLFIIQLEQRNPEGSTKRGKLNLVDLAGSEKVAKTGAEGQTLLEAKNINGSLSALGNCINALTENRPHIPYRDSKLTRILQESLGGNTKTTLICACSPHSYNIEETISTLRFGARAKTIKNTVKVNAQKSAAELMRLVDQLKRELAASENYCSLLEKKIKWMEGPDYKPGAPMPPELEMEIAKAVEQTRGHSSEKMSRTSSMESIEDEEGNTEPVPRPVAVDHFDRHGEQATALAELRAELERQREEKDAAISNLQDEIAEKEMEIKEFEDQLLDTKDKLNELEDEMAVALEELEGEKDGREAEKKKFEYETKQHEVELEALSNNIDELKEERDEAIDQLKQLQLDVEELEKQLEKSKRENERVKAELEITFEELAHTEQEYADVQTKYDKISQEAVSLKEKYSELQKERDDLLEYIAEVENESKEHEMKALETSSKLKMKEQEAETLKSKLEESKTQYKDLESRYEEIDKEKKVLEDEEKTHMQQLQKLASEDELVKKLQKELDKISSEKEKLVVQSENHRAKFVEFEKQAEELKEKEQALRNKLLEKDSAIEKAELQSRTFETKLENEQVRLVSTMEKLEEKERELEDMRSEMEHVQKNYDSVKMINPAETEKFKEQISSLEEEKKQLNEKISKLEEEIKKLKGEVDKHKKEEQSEKNKVSTLQQKLDNQAHRMQELEKSLETYTAIKKEADEARRERDEAKRELGELRGKYEEVVTLQNQIAVRKAKVYAPVNGSSLLEAFRTKIDFGTHLLRSTNSSILEAAREEARRAQMPIHGQPVFASGMKKDKEEQ